MAFKTYCIIPLLEHCSQIWNPHIVADVRRLESVQRLFTKRLPGFQGLGYLARLKKASLHTLELRRLWADLCFCYKMLRSHVDTPIDQFFVLNTAEQTRGHNWKLKSKTARLDSRLHFFSYRVVRVWNSLSPDTVNASSIFSFKAFLRRENLDSFLIKPRRGGYQIAAPGNWVTPSVCLSVRPSVCPRRIVFQGTNAVWLNVAFYESP